jgi:hypothetical protein
MKTITTCFIVGIFFTLIGILGILNIQVLAQVEIAGKTESWRDNSTIAGPTYHIAGEVINKGNEDVGIVEIAVTLYDAGGNVIGTDNTYVIPDTIPAGEKAPFQFRIHEGSSVSDLLKIQNYSLIVDDPS